MKTIYKYVLRRSEIDVKMPIGANILSVGGFNGELCVWAEVDTELPLESVVFEVYATGDHVQGHIEGFIGTALFEKQGLVFHVYKSVW
jgi:hypothetical protein